jgi:hypothetical protein
MNIWHDGSKMCQLSGGCISRINIHGALAEKLNGGDHLRYLPLVGTIILERILDILGHLHVDWVHVRQGNVQHGIM